MQVGDLVMKRDGLIEGSPHYLRGYLIDGKQGVISEEQRTTQFIESVDQMIMVPSGLADIHYRK